MGWTSYQGADEAAALAAHLADCKVILGPVWRPDRGEWRSRAWVLVVAADGLALVVLCVVEAAHGVPGASYWVKDVDETMGPLFYDCPPEWLAWSQPRAGFSAEWRAKVRDYWRQVGAGGA
jgi:hypothetical protein